MALVTAKYVLSYPQVHRATWHQARLLLDLRVLPCHDRSNGWIHDGAMLDQLSILKAVVGNAVCSVKLLVEIVIAQFKADELKDQQADRQSRSESKNVDRRECFVLQDIPKGDEDVASKHNNLE